MGHTVFTQLLGVGSALNTKTPGGHREKGNEVTWFSLFKNRKTHQFFDGSLSHMARDAQEALRRGFPTSLLGHVGWLPSPVNRMIDREGPYLLPRRSP